MFARRRQESEAEARAAWLDAAAILEARSRADFKHVQDAHVALVDTFSALRSDLAKRDAQLGATLDRLGAVCATLAERIEADREERRELVQTISTLATALIARSDAPAPQIVGGSVFGEERDDIDDDGTPGATLDLFAVEVGEQAAARTVAANGAPRAGEPVRCRFGDRWVEGFEVVEVHSREGRARYRVRRRADGSVVRKLFEASDLEPVREAAPFPETQPDAPARPRG
jgi:hypothetical protein